MKKFKYTILLVEDDSSILKLLDFIFKKEYNTILAENGQIAYNKVQEIKPDLIISDIMMPELTGIELKEKLNFDNETAKIPFFFLSAINDEETKAKIQSLEAELHLVKPVKPLEIKEKVKEIFSSYEI